jgi:hypothetical protein
MKENLIPLVLLFLNLNLLSTGQAQIIQNGGFENGTSGWTLSGGAQVSGKANFFHTGSNYLWLGDDNGTDTAYQQISIPSNATAASPMAPQPKT